jgi:hypothetical protein
MSSCLANGLIKAEFAGSVRLNPKSKDPMIAIQDPQQSIFVIPQPNGLRRSRSWPFDIRFTTKAAGYVFLPNVTAIRFIAGL